MEYDTLGRSGLKVSPLALGTMTFGTDWGWGADERASRDIFNAYVEAGGNFFDTADIYTNGASEELLGRFVEDRSMRDLAVIATKFSFNAQPGNPNAGGNGRKNMRRAIEGSLSRLGTDYVDLYILHAWDRTTPPEDVLRSFVDLIGEGKILHYGLSNVPAWYAARMQTLAEAHGLEPPSTLQLEYSLVERAIENEYVALAKLYDLGIMVWSPLGSGLLSGKYRPEGQGAAPSTGRLSQVAGSGNTAFDKFTKRNWAIVAELERVAATLGRSMAQVAINWVARRAGVSSVLIGATRVEQLTETTAALDFEIPADLMRRLDEVSAPCVSYPYSFFSDAMQAGITGEARVAVKPQHFRDTTAAGHDPADPAEIS